MVDKDFCLSSYIGLRYIYEENKDFFEGMHHTNYILPSEEERVLVSTAKEINEFINKQFEELYKNYTNIGILLSGGMDSAVLSSYLKEGSNAYTFSNNETDIYNSDIERSKKYCEKFGLKQHFVNIDFADYQKYTPIVMQRKCAPVHSIEPQIYKAAKLAQNDGVELMIIGDAADYVFGGMDKLMSKDWTYEAFIERYLSLDPKLVLENPSDITGAFEPYKKGDKIDYLSFMEGPTTIESYGSYENALSSAGMKYCDPYEKLKMREPLDLNRIRKGESKYLIRDMYRMKFSDIEVPEKIPMPRPVDVIFKNWQGPTRKEFRKDIPMNELTGNQKWQLWCAEQFLNEYEKDDNSDHKNKLLTR